MRHTKLGITYGLSKLSVVITGSSGNRILRGIAWVCRQPRNVFAFLLTGLGHPIVALMQGVSLTYSWLFFEEENH